MATYDPSLFKLKGTKQEETRGIKLLKKQQKQQQQKRNKTQHPPHCRIVTATNRVRMHLVSLKQLPDKVVIHSMFSPSLLANLSFMNSAYCHI